jgi:hypothetical protein
MNMFGRQALVASLLLVSLGLAGCGAEVSPPNVPRADPEDQAFRDRYGTLGGGEMTLFSNRSAEEEAGTGGGGIGVNAYLWRGALETIDFMPLQAADPFGGLIITDWYQSVESPGERLRLQVLIRDAALRADGVKVTVLRQVRDGGEWLNAPADPATATIIEDKILTRARELRVAGL